MALNGDLNDMSLIDLIEVFQIGVKSGVLYLSEGTRLGLLYVTAGHVVDAVVLTWPERITTLASDAALAAMLQWQQANFIFHHQLVDRPVTIGRVVEQRGAESALAAHAASAPAQQPGLALTKVQPALTVQHRAQDRVCGPHEMRMSTHLSSDQSQHTASRWSLDLEPFMHSAKPTVSETNTLYVPATHRQARTTYAMVGVVRTKLIATVMQRIREL